MDGAFQPTQPLLPGADGFADLPRRYDAAAVQVLAAAFAADAEFVRYFWADVAPERRHFTALFRGYFLGHICRYQPLAIRHGGNIVGVANYAHLSPEAAGLATTLQAVGARLWAKQIIPGPVMARIQTYHRALYFPATPCFSINQLGVAPEWQDRGYGRRLLTEIFARSAADPYSEGVLVTTYSQTKAAYYERQGFQRLAEYPQGPVWAISLFASHHSVTV